MPVMCISQGHLIAQAPLRGYKATRGWQAPPDKVQKIIDRISQPRKDLLMTRALLSLHIRAPRRDDGDTVEWLMGSSSSTREDTR
eukprot:262806-Karenia_brevis.AAC.1